MHAKAPTRSLASLASFALLLFLAGCDTGNGPTPIPGNPPPPPPPAGTCDANITFEPECGTPRGEVPTPINFNGGATDIEPNPVPSADNDSPTVAKMRKFPEEVFGGTKFVWPGGAIDFSQGEFFKMKVWASRSVPVTFKLEEIGNPAGGDEDVQTHTGNSQWQTLCFDLTGQAVPTPVIETTIIFDNGVLGNWDADNDFWTFYYDDIEQVQSCGAPPAASPIDPDAALFSSTRDPDLVIPDDYDEVTAFDSGSVIDPMYAEDPFFSPVLSVWSGTGYGANIAQVGFIGFEAGFLDDYSSIDFKVKGMPNQVINVKLYDGVSTLRINLTSSEFSGALAQDGWFQVSIPIERFSGNATAATGIVFESDDSSPEQFRMLLTDIGFEEIPRTPADPGITPDAIVYATDPGLTEDLAPPGGIQNFGSGATFDQNFMGDDDFNPALQVTAGTDFGGQFVGFAAFTGYAAGFASTYETFVFKVKADAALLTNFEVQFFGPAQPLVIPDLATYTGTTDLGNGWLQVEVPMSNFAAEIANNDGFLIGPQGDRGAAFTYLLTDIGFLNPTGGPADPGITPDAVVYATDPGLTEDLAPPGGIQDFGSGATFDQNFMGDAERNPALQVTSGNNFGGGTEDVGFTAFTGYTGGFASSYETFVFKIKADAALLTNFEVQFFGPAQPLVIPDLATYTGTTDLGNGWLQVEVPMSNFAAEIANNDGFLIGPQGDRGAAFTYLLTDIGFMNPSGGGGGTLVNGDFENGLTGWTQTQDPDGVGSITAEAAQGGRAGTVARLVTAATGTQFNDLLISQEFLGQGTTSPGDNIDVSFDLYGSLAGAGGVVFVEVIFLDAGGMETGRDFLNSDPTPYGPTTTWTTYSGTVTAGADVSGGVTLSLKASCGAIDGCGVDASFDNVTLTIN